MRALLLCFLLVLPPLQALGQSPLPDRRLDVSRDVDFYGADLQPLFEVSLEACQRACLGNPECRAFTYNTRSAACFPKSGISDRVPYPGAVSAEVLDTPPQVQARAAERAAASVFLSDADIAAARDQARGLGMRHPGGARDTQALEQAASEARARGDLRGALDRTGAVTARTDEAGHWLDYALLARRIAQDTPREARAWHERALSASVNAWLRAGPTPLRVSALTVMARSFEELGRGRDMIPALRLAQSIAPRDEVAALLERAVAQYGFRILETEVESDQARPRLCARFSEPLVPAGVDYATYVRLPVSGLVVEADGRDICLDGVAHGERYTVTFRAGLPAQSGETLASDTEITLYVRDRQPTVRFPGRAYILPRAEASGIPVETVNLDTVDLTLRRVSDRNLLRAMQEGFFARPLDPWQEQRFGGEVAEEVWTGTARVQNELNREMVTRLPMTEVIAGQPPGIYALTAAIPGAEPWEQAGATQWFVLSDLGLTTMMGNDGLHVFVRGLSDAAPREDVVVELLSRANRVLGTAQTDARGYARFAPGLARGTGGAAPAMVTVRQGEDMAFLSLTDPAFDLSDRGVEGREAPPPVDVFLTTDRGAYRAGETVHATALARDAEARAIEGLPLTAILTRPDGVEYARRLSAAGMAGGHVFGFDIAGSAPRGTWRLEVKADPEGEALAATPLLVEDFLPERIEVGLSLPDAPLHAGATTRLSVEARYLFGAPAAGLPVEGRVRLSPTDRLEGWPGYRFGLHDEGAEPRTVWLPSGTATGDDGAATLAAELPPLDGPARPAEAEFVVTVAEGSGRPVEEVLTRAVAPTGPLVGIRPLFDGVVEEGSEARFRLIGLDAEGAASPMRLGWTVNRVETRYQWYQLHGSWNWEPVTSRTRVAGGEVSPGTEPAEIAVPVDWGRYEIVLERLDGAYAASSISFDAGWYAPAGAADTPDMLEVSLDAERYRPGETATLRMVPRHAGVALISVVSDRLIAMQSVEVSEGENTVELPVTEDWGTGAYVTAQVIRPMDADQNRNPARALGLAHAGIAPGDRALDVTLDAPAEAAPRAPLTVGVEVGGVAEGETAHVTLAAVDVGILNLTGFGAPDPSGHYFGQRRLGVELRDVYGRLIDGLNGRMGEVRSGGDAGARLRAEAPPPTEELVAFFEGPVTVGPDGRAEITFDLPAFDGTVRLMAVAWSRAGVGEAAQDVLVRDPVVVNASLPRFLSPGDESRLLLELTHAEGPAGRMGVDVTADGVTLGAEPPSGVTLTEGQTARLSLPITAGGPGEASVRVALTTPDGRQLVKQVPLGIRVTDPPVARTRRLALAAGDTLPLDDQIFAGFRPGTGTALVSAGPLARFDAPGILASLDRYPYGCTEQVTSQALPLMSLAPLAEAVGLGRQAAIDAKLREAIRLILTRQAANGAFGLWSAGSGDFWLDAYVSDFLSRARAAGYEVPDTAFRAAMGNLRNRVNTAPDFDRGGEDLAYALMVLAREGAAALGDLRYYADVKADAFATPLAQAQLGAALASYGETRRADAMFARAVRSLERGETQTGWRADYGTALRDAAGVLTLAVASGSEAVDRSALAARIAQAEGRHSTQEQAWMLLAAEAMLTDPALAGVTLDGQPLDLPVVRLSASELSEPRALTNGMDRATDLTITTFGVPEGAVEASGYGYTLRRSYYTLDGEAAQFPVSSGERLVAVLEVRPADAAGGRLIVDDPLPAGLEIDNPNLLRTGDIAALDWLETAAARHAEFRADRFLAQVDWTEAEPFRLAYIVRAVSPGTYHHPAAVVEDMYRPRYRANTASGRLTVTE
ncbi:alpha-2-macroglobulin family protein [Rhodosalinus halophilus]|uniref:Alpha-2-macroglobulin family protein n=1 Tax=Rhodosalinus halophilus TaxID=2259333 RepID=A0A365U4P5_9RHOB|nr:alpha-2-macroglobulin family protein [Rhodosalinus halophilus]RBI83122.1 alpha-2-macroglobulin family protein [Rhodosalinus halophilus]